MIAFHRFLIATAIVFCLGLAVWMFAAYAAEGAAYTVVLGAAFGVAAVALSYYLKNLERFLHRQRRGMDDRH